LIGKRPKQKLEEQRRLFIGNSAPAILVWKPKTGLRGVKSR